MRRRRDRCRSRSSCSRSSGPRVAYYLHVKQQARDIKGSSTIEFVTTEAALPPPREPGIAWPTYGRDPERRRFANGVSLAPPFRTEWTFRAQSLIEFPPVVGYGRLFFANNDGDRLRGRREEREARLEVRVAPLRRRLARARPACRLRDVPERAAVQPPAERGAHG